MRKTPRIELDLKLAFLRYRIHKLEQQPQQQSTSEPTKTKSVDPQTEINELRKRIRAINEELARREEEEHARKAKRRSANRKKGGSSSRISRLFDVSPSINPKASGS